MEHAARHHISVHFDEDPVYYKNLSEHLEEILQKYSDNWDERAAALEKYTQNIQNGRQENGTGLDPQREQPFFDLLQQQTNIDQAPLIEVTREILTHIIATISRINFWNNPVAQNNLKTWIVNYLDDQDIVSFEQQEAIADQLVQLAKKRHQWLVR